MLLRTGGWSAVLISPWPLTACGGGDGDDSTAGLGGSPTTERNNQTTPTDHVDVTAVPFRASGDGITDDTAAFQAAIDAAGKVFVPPGVYLIRNLRLRDGTSLLGADKQSILKQAGDANMITAESASGQAHVVDITMKHLQFVGQVATLGFREHTHLVAVNGVRRLVVEDCIFRGFRGDGIYLGGLSTTGSTERHNVGVRITGCEFDGVNGDNRNGVTVIDGDDVLIERNHFHDCTRHDMPGAVDIEPNHHPFHRVRNIHVRHNTFLDVGGNVGAVAVVLAGHRYTTHPENFEIGHNTIDRCTGYGFAFVHRPAAALTVSSPSHRVRVHDNLIRQCRGGFGLTGIAGMDMENNEITDTHGCYIAYLEPNTQCIDVTLRRNRFVRCGSEGGIGLNVFHVNQLMIQENAFFDCGSGQAGAYAVDFKNGRSSSVSIVDNTFASPGGMTRVAIQKEANHVFDVGSNELSGNDFGGLPHNFAAH
nr:right-handed parallel beta-helix repeat-containing protein [uncultured Caldimonas sp.]